MSYFFLSLFSFRSFAFLLSLLLFLYFSFFIALTISQPLFIFISFTFFLYLILVILLFFRSFFVSSIVENKIIELPLLDETTKLEVTSTTEPQSFLEIVQQSYVNQQLNDKQKVTTENPLNVLSTINSNTSPRYAYVHR